MSNEPRTWITVSLNTILEYTNFEEQNIERPH